MFPTVTIGHLRELPSITAEELVLYLACDEDTGAPRPHARHTTAKEQRT